MALKNCRECNTQVSSEARICPNCGIKKPYLSRIKSIVFLLVIAGVVYSKINSDSNVLDNPIALKPSLNTFSAPDVNVPANKVKPFTLYQVCRAGIAMIMGRETDTVKVSPSPSALVVLVSYKRPDDGKNFSYQCKLSGNFIIWSEAGVSTNRWEGKGEIDSLLTYTLNTNNVKTKDGFGSTLIIEEKYSDKSQIKKEFTLSQLSLPKRLRGD